MVLELRARGESFKIILSRSIASSVEVFLGTFACAGTWNKDLSRNSSWKSSVLMVNAVDATFNPHDISNSLLIIDGDLDLKQLREVRNSILLINGSLSVQSKIQMADSYIYSTGRMKFDLGSRITSTTLFNKGDIERPINANYQHWDIREPFGIKFFQLSDVGLSVKSHARGAEITALSPFSPLKLFGLRVGDVVTKVDERAIDSPDALRRASRAAYVRESGVYYLLRNGQAIDRIVLFGDYQLP